VLYLLRVLPQQRLLVEAQQQQATKGTYSTTRSWQTDVSAIRSICLALQDFALTLTHISRKLDFQLVNMPCRKTCIASML
jgi:hypothetical protein